MATPQQALENVQKQMENQILNFLRGLNQLDELSKKRLQDSLQRERSVEAEIKRSEEKEALINREWLPVLKAREENIKKINEQLFNENKICQRLQAMQLLPSSQAQPQKDEAVDSSSPIYESIFIEQSALPFRRQ